MEEPITMPKRGRGRPKGSKDTKPRKSYVCKAFSYTPEQAALVKYILRQDKEPSKRRMEGLKERMRTLRNSQPPIPADRMEELEATYAEQCKLHQSWLVDREIAETEKRILLAEKERKVKDASQQKRKPKKRVPAGIRTDLLQQINSEEHRQIKQLLFQGLGISDSHKTSKVSAQRVKYWMLMREKINKPEDFLHTPFSPRQKLAARCAYEAWIIRQMRPDINLNPLLMSLLRLYSVYYLHLRPKDALVAETFTEEDLDNFGEHSAVLTAMRDFYSLLVDLPPYPTNLKVQRAVDRIVEMEEWNYTFDFLYKQNRHPGDYDLICIYHGKTHKLGMDNSLICPVCQVEKPDLFHELQQQQQTEAVNMEEDLKAEFIRKSREIHGDKYDYTLVEFVNWSRPVLIRCKIHDFVFPMAPNDHLKGRGCKKCAKNQLKTTEEFVSELRAIYGDAYDYTLTRYVNSKTNVVCVCKKHNEPVIRTPQNLLRGWGCSHCMKEQGKTWGDVMKYDKEKRNERSTKEKFVLESRKIHGDKYDYTDVIYFNNDTDVAIRCRNCGTVFPAKPKEHLRGFGTCPNCEHGRKDHSENIRLQTFIRRANEIHHNRYVYLDKDVHHDTLVHILCHLHGEFTLTPQEHLAGFGCPTCFPQQDAKGGMSEGEKRVKAYLDRHKIDYIYNKEIVNPYHLSNREHLRPDFMLPELNAVVEFNGEQHYRFVEAFHIDEEGFRQQQLRDDEMRRYCKDRGIRLLEIRFDEIDQIAKILKDFL